MKSAGLTNTQLKLIAIITMALDHIGRELLPKWAILTIIGRLAFPIFAYMIAEGCRHTRHRFHYIGMVAGFGTVCQLVYFIATGSMYQNILITFSLSILTIYTLDYCTDTVTSSGTFFQSLMSVLILLIELAFIVILCKVLPERVASDFCIDYGLIGVLTPVPSIL